MEHYFVRIPRASSRVEENSNPSARDDNSPGPIGRFKILQQNVINRLREQIRRKEPEHPSVPEGNTARAEPTINELGDNSRGHPDIISHDSMHNEEIITLENERPIEENRNNRRNLIQRSRDQMRNWLSHIHPANLDFIKAIIFLCGVLAGLAITIFVIHDPENI